MIDYRFLSGNLRGAAETLRRQRRHCKAAGHDGGCSTVYSNQMSDCPDLDGNFEPLTLSVVAFA